MSKRQRHVFSNREIPHLWAHQTQDEARNGTASFYFRGATIYSYGSHFPIATHVKGSQGPFHTEEEPARVNDPETGAHIIW